MKILAPFLTTSKKSLGVILRTYLFFIPSGIIWLGFFVLSIKTFQEFYYSGNFSLVSFFYFPIIAISVALASVCFTYSRTIVNTESDKHVSTMISVGELFLYAVVALVFVLTIGWFSFEIKRYTGLYFPDTEWETGGRMVASFILGSGQIFLFYAANSLHKAFINLEDQLWQKVKTHSTFPW